MGPTRDLYDLVRSLAKGEAQRVTVDLKRTKSATSLALFRAYLDAKSFDDKAIKAQFPRTFFKAKERLRDRILDILADSTKAHNALQLVLVHINRITVWRSKGLFLAAERSIAKATALALEIERFDKVLELLAMKRELWADYLPVRFREPAFDQFIEFREEIETKAQNIQELETLLDSLLKAYGVAPSHQSKLIDLVKDHPMIAKAEPLLSVNAHILYHRIQINLARLERDLVGLLSWTQKACVIIRENPAIGADPRVAWQYGTLGYMGGMFAVAVNDFVAAEEGVELLRGLMKDRASIEFQTATWQRLWTLEVAIAKKTLDEPRAIQAEKEIGEGLKRYGGNLNPSLTISMYHALAEVLFYFGHVASAAVWVRKMMQIDDLTYKPVLVLYARIFFLIVHLELEDIRSIESNFRSIEYFLKKHQALTDFESTVIRFVRASIKTPDTAEKNQLWSQLADDLATLFGKAEFQQRADCLALLEWARHKATGSIFLDLLTEKFADPR